MGFLTGHEFDVDALSLADLGDERPNIDVMIFASIPASLADPF